MGRIVFIGGPMFSGKTTELFARLRTFIVAEKEVILLKHTRDDRYGNKNGLNQSHDGMQMICQEISDLSSFDVSSYDVIGIDEGQFFSNLAESCVKWRKLDKTIIVAGLNATAKNTPWPEISNLVSVADDIIMVHTVCILCGDSQASRTKAIVEVPLNNILVGGSEKFVPTCWPCQELEIPQKKLNQRQGSIKKIKKLFTNLE